MYRLLSKISVVAGLITGAIQAPTACLQRRESNILPGFNADPALMIFGDTYWIYPTNDGLQWEGKDFYAWSSTNLVDWTRGEQPILTLDAPNGNVPWANGKAWAPAIIERNHKYYLYFSGFNPSANRLTIGVASADSPGGPFRAEPEAMIYNTEAITAIEAIDPMAFHDPVTNKYWLFWGNGRLVYAELNEDMVSINWDTLRQGQGMDEYFEAPFIVWRDGLYHMTWSIDDTRNPTYRVGYASADNIHGPWQNHGIILSQDPAHGILGTGHQSIIRIPGTDEWYMAYHRFGIPGGDGQHRETTIDRMYFNAEGFIERIIPTLDSVPAREV